jgi:biotin synthesis protein BioG
MKTYIRRREKNNELVVFYSSWGTDENLFTPLCTDEFDFILFYNYSADEAFVLPEMKSYRKITLIGWSLGVWAAEYLSQKTKIIPDISIAVNGTPVPADDHFGVPLNVFEGTLNNISEQNMEKFYLRMFGDKDTYEANRNKLPDRSVKSLHDELRWLYNRIMEAKEPEFRWNFVVTSESDRIFPPDNVNNYWSKEKIPYPHYFFNNWKSYADFISFVETHK